MRVSLCYELISSIKRNKKERETSKWHVGVAHSVLITAILLLRQNSVTAHADQS
jgi:hypothetical protein